MPLTSIAVRARLLRDGAHPKVAFSQVLGGNNNIVALSHSDGDVGGVVWVDRHVVSSDDLQCVVVDHEAEVSVGGGIHESDAVAGVGLERGLEPGSAVIVRVGAVDETIRRRRRPADRGCEHEVVGGVVVPVVQDNVAKVDVVVGSRRAVDEDASKHTVPGLDIEVRVPPSSPVICCAPLVREAIAGSNRALCYASNTVHIIRPLLSDTVPVDRRSVVLQRVLDVYNYQ